MTLGEDLRAKLSGFSAIKTLFLSVEYRTALRREKRDFVCSLRLREQFSRYHIVIEKGPWCHGINTRGLFRRLN